MLTHSPMSMKEREQTASGFKTHAARKKSGVGPSGGTGGTNIGLLQSCAMTPDADKSSPMRKATSNGLYHQTLSSTAHKGGQSPPSASTSAATTQSGQSP